MIVKKFYKCNICGNIFGVVNDSGVIPVCCAEPMVVLKANSTDAAAEKHVPVIERSGDMVTVKVGSVPHPMTDEHYIQWIIVTNKSGFTERIELKPAEEPLAAFTMKENEGPVTAYEYCTLHGLWVAEE